MIAPNQIVSIHRGEMSRSPATQMHAYRCRSHILTYDHFYSYSLARLDEKQTLPLAVVL